MPHQPSQRSISRSNWITSLFSVNNLNTKESIEEALREFQSALNPENFDNILDTILALESGRILALIISQIDDDCMLLPWLSEEFPDDFQSLPTSKHCTILLLLSMFFLTVEDADVSQHHNVVINLPSIVSALLRISFSDTSLRKKSRKGRNAIEVSERDAELLRNLKIPLPESPSERDEVGEGVLRHAEEILMLYIATLRSEKASNKFLQLFMGSDSLEDVKARHDASGLGHLRLSATFTAMEGFGQWRLLILTRAEQDLRSLSRKEPKSFDAVVEKLRDLSHGFFSESDQRAPYGVRINVPIYQARILHLYILFQVDCMIDNEQKAEIQALKVYGLYKHNELDHAGFWKAIAYHLGQRGGLYEKRCTIRQSVMSPEHGVSQYIPISFTIQTVEPQTSGSATALALPPDDLEQLQVLNTFSRMYPFSEGFLQALKDDLPVGLFLELSPQEKTIVEHPHSCYVIGRSGTGKTLTMLHKMLLVERASMQLGIASGKPRQVFVTKSRLLASKVAQEYNRSAIALGLRHKQEDDPDGDEFSSMIDYNDETFSYYRSTEGSGFDGLKDADFPLFISFDTLCDLLLEAARDTAEYKALKKKPIISAAHFLHRYWPRLASGTDAATVFSEILGVIKGSGVIHGRGASTLERVEYEHLSSRSYPTFAQRRAWVYDIFIKYKALKRQQLEFDAADRTRFILNWIQNFGLRGRKIDYLYVDEVQDNLLLDALLLRAICANPNGMFWAGDTAQCISPGSSFRFNDLKQLLYEIEVQSTNPSLISRPQSQLFHLAVNYRSHAGINRCANAVVDFIARYWPNTLDVLPSESGLPGPKPLVLCGWEMDVANFDEYLFYDRNRRVLDFGPEQCILVRNAETKKRIREIFAGAPTAVLTIYDCKGMEFDDVMLYNFFEDSDAELNQWRLLLGELENANAPAFDAMKHAVICSELKNLYVAMTRARRTVCIVDSSSRALPMKMFWLSKKLIDIGVPGPGVIAMLPSSTPAGPGHGQREQFDRKGQELFNQGLFEDAARFFMRAGNSIKAEIAGAYHLKLLADQCLDGSQVRRAQNKQAGEAFVHLAKKGTSQSQEYWRVAGMCFRNVGDVRKAVAALCRAGVHSLAAQVYAEKHMYDQAIDFIKRFPERIDRGIAQDIREEAANSYFHKAEFEKALDCFPTPCDKQALEFLNRHALLDIKLNLLLHLGRFSEAAEIYKSNDRSHEAIQLWMKECEGRKESAQKAADEIILCLSKTYKFGTNPRAPPNLEKLQELMKWKGELEKLLPSPFRNKDEAQMFEKLAAGDLLALFSDARRFYDAHNRAAFFLSMHYHCQSISKWPLNLAGRDLIQKLRLFLRYGVELVSLSSGNLELVEKVFGIVLDAEKVKIPRGSFLANSSHFENQDLVFKRDDFRRRLGRVLSEYVAKLIRTQDGWCRRVFSLQSEGCIYTISPDFTASSCFLKHSHNASVEVRWEAYAYQLRIVNLMLEQFGAQEPSDRLGRADMRYWLSRLYCTFNFTFGCHPPWWPLNIAQEAQVDKYRQVAENTQLSTVFGQDQELNNLIYGRSEISSSTIRSFWMLRSIWATSSALDRKGSWAFADTDRICVYLERLTTVLVIIPRRGNLHNLKLPRAWTNQKVYRLGSWKWNHTHGPGIELCMTELWRETRRMLDRCRRNTALVLYRTPFIIRLCTVLYILARETDHWVQIRDVVLSMMPWSGSEVPEDSPSINRLVQVFLRGHLVQFLNISGQQSPRDLEASLNNAGAKVVYETVDWSWLPDEVVYS